MGPNKAQLASSLKRLQNILRYIYWEKYSLLMVIMTNLGSLIMS